MLRDGFDLFPDRDQSINAREMTCSSETAERLAHPDYPMTEAIADALGIPATSLLIVEVPDKGTLNIIANTEHGCSIRALSKEEVETAWAAGTPQHRLPLLATLLTTFWETSDSLLGLANMFAEGIRLHPKTGLPRPTHTAIEQERRMAPAIVALVDQYRVGLLAEGADEATATLLTELGLDDFTRDLWANPSNRAARKTQFRTAWESALLIP